MVKEATRAQSGARWKLVVNSLLGCFIIASQPLLKLSQRR